MLTSSETRAGDRQLGRVGASASEHRATRAAAQNELDVKMAEPVGHGRAVVDHENVMLGGQSLGERVADFAAPNDGDLHRFSFYMLGSRRSAADSTACQSGAIGILGAHSSGLG